MVVVLVVAASDLMHNEESRQVRLQIPKLSLHSANKALRETSHQGYINHNRIVVPVQLPEKPKMVAEEIEALLSSVMDTGVHQQAFMPVSAAIVADRFDD